MFKEGLRRMIEVIQRNSPTFKGLSAIRRPLDRGFTSSQFGKSTSLLRSKETARGRNRARPAWVPRKRRKCEKFVHRKIDEESGRFDVSRRAIWKDGLDTRAKGRRKAGLRWGREQTPTVQGITKSENPPRMGEKTRNRKQSNKNQGVELQFSFLSGKDQVGKKRR